MKTIVTGASGFVGSAIVRCLLGAGRRVRVLLRSGSPRTIAEPTKPEAPVTIVSSGTAFQGVPAIPSG